MPDAIGTDETALRRCVLAVSVLHDLDLAPADDGVPVPDENGVLVTWAMIAQVAGPAQAGPPPPAPPGPRNRPPGTGWPPCCGCTG